MQNFTDLDLFRFIKINFTIGEFSNINNKETMCHKKNLDCYIEIFSLTNIGLIITFISNVNPWISPLNKYTKYFRYPTL